MTEGLRTTSIANGLITSVVTICSSRKSVPITQSSTPVSLPKAAQSAVQAAWVQKVSKLPARYAVDQLYAGRGFRLAKSAAASVRARLYVVSAGLGLVAADRQVPVYGLTVSPGHAESVAARVQGDFDPAAWFSAILQGPHSVQWADAFAEGEGRVLVALTRPYAEMIGSSLLALPASSLGRLRIFGVSLSKVLPTEIQRAVMPYDGRLDTIIPGTRADFSQRALDHFARLVASGADDQDREADSDAVRRALAGVISPRLAQRPRQTDEEILRLIRKQLMTQSGVGRVLRALRDQDGVACEQARFSRLYRAAVADGALI